MDKVELRLLELQSRVFLWERTARQFAELIRTHPQGDAELRKWAMGMRSGAAGQTFPGQHPAVSDHWASIVQEATEDILKALGVA